MHYKDGREAKEGDHVIAMVYRGGQQPKPTAGVIHSLQPAASSCNAMFAYPLPGSIGSTCVTVGECVHVEDAMEKVDLFLNPPEPAAVAPA